MDDFSGRVAVVTGAASGIGLASAHAFAKAGMKLVLADMDRDALARAVAGFEAVGVEVLGQVTDVGDRAQVTALADAAWARFGATHILFNNAGVAVYGAVQDLRPVDWEFSIRVNLWGVIHGVDAFLPRLLAQNEPAHIVNTASFAGLVASQSMTAYNTAKAAVVSLTESMRNDLRGSPIGVSVLCPMMVRTNVWETSGRNRAPEFGGGAAHRRRTAEENAAMQGRILTAEDTALMVMAGIRARQLYIITHDEARPFIRRKYERLDGSFEPKRR